MQPLISVDHESRHSSYRAEEDAAGALAAAAGASEASEATPLLRHRFPPPEQRFSTFSAAVMSLLLVILIFGAVIGIYLLIVQNNSENILPPINMPLQLVSQSQWATSRLSLRPGPASPAAAAARARHVIAVQTDSAVCHTTASCSALLNALQGNSSRKLLPYNFLISSNGETFEALGWRRRASLFPQYSATSLVLAFIGNFTEISPTRHQLDEAINFLAASVSLQHLEPIYTIIGKKTRENPTQLFSSLKTFPQWNEFLSDK